MKDSYKDVSLVVLDGDAPLEYQPWGSPLRGYVTGLKVIEPWISEPLKKYDDHRFEVLFDTPEQLRARKGGWARVVGAIADTVQAAHDSAAADRIVELMLHVCSTLVKDTPQPSFRKVGFHLVSIVSKGQPTSQELFFRDELITRIENELQLPAGRGLETYEAGDADVFLSQMRQSTTRMVAHLRYWERIGKYRAHYQPS
jgi:hypothetical protein